MALRLLTGPAGSGKTGAVLDRFTAALEREPVLVVPTLADVQRFEQELLARLPVAVGGRITTFDGLFAMAATAAEAPPLVVLTPAQRRAVVAATVADARLAALAEPARRGGFVDALDQLIGEVQAARVAPGDFSTRLRGRAAAAPAGGAYLREIASLYAAYHRRRDAAGRGDAHTLAAAAIAGLGARPAGWGGRPVLVHGFDDLTTEQLELVQALAGAAEVTVTVVHEPGRACLVARERLLGRLESLAGERGERLEPHTGTDVLSHLERSFLGDDPVRRTPDGSLVLLEAAGARAEVEQVGAQIARLLRGGARPEEIAVIVRSPADHAGLIDEVIGGYGIPLALDAQLPFGHAALGRGLIALVRAALVTRSAADLLTWLRSSRGVGGPGRIDRLERAVRQGELAGAEEAVAAWAEAGGRELWELRVLHDAHAAGHAALLDAVADLAHGMFEWPHRRTASILDPGGREDQQAAEAAGRALAEIAELASHDPALAPGAAGLVELLEGLGVWRSPPATTGRVEVMSPYRARARRFAHVFVLSMMEGDFPRRGRDNPFLTEDERLAAGLPERADQRDEERYLFYVALSRATRRLYLSYRSADDEGQALTRSFFVDDVLELLEEDAAEGLIRRRRLSDTVFAAPEAPTEHELARALAARELTAAPPELGAAPELAERLRRRLTTARVRAHRLPGSLTVGVVREHFASRAGFGASSLEQYVECPFRYFVGHELKPGVLEPDSDARARGTLVHCVLEQVYQEMGAPSEDNLEAVIVRAREVLAERAGGTALEPRAPRARAVYRRMESDVARFIRYDAEHPVGMELLQVEAGFGHEGEPPGLGLDGFTVHGKIDRIDGSPGGPGLVRDYKTGSSVSSRAEVAREGKLQLQLYMLTARERFGIDPVGGIYHPLGDQAGARPRGILRGPAGEGVLPRDPFVGNDFTADAEEFERCLTEARRQAEAVGHAIQAGVLRRDPHGGSCPRHCDFQSICRRERGQKNPREEPVTGGTDE